MDGHNSIWESVTHVYTIKNVVDFYTFELLQDIR